MSRAAAAARTRSHARRPAAPPRRVSGPARGRSGGAATITAPPPLALRIGGAVQSVAEHRFLERIIRGRAWIAILAVGLIGIVFMQVSMLRMNAGIGRDVDQATRLERDNAAMRATLSELTSGDRIEAQAAKLGFVLPPAGAARFLSARRFDPARALSNIQPPSHLAALPVGTTSTVTSTTATAALPATGVAPSPQTTTTAGTATGTTATPTSASATPPSTATSTPPSTLAPPTTSTPSSSPQGTAAATPPPAGTTATATGGAAATGGASATGAG